MKIPGADYDHALDMGLQEHYARLAEMERKKDEANREWARLSAIAPHGSVTDAEICTWIVTLGCIDAEDFSRRRAPYDKMGDAMVYFWRWDVIRHWRRKAILAFHQEAQCA